MIMKPFILVKDTTECHVILKLLVDEIVLFEAQRNYVLIHLVNRKVKVYISFIN